MLMYYQGGCSLCVSVWPVLSTTQYNSSFIVYRYIVLPVKESLCRFYTLKVQCVGFTSI